MERTGFHTYIHLIQIPIAKNYMVIDNSIISREDIVVYIFRTSPATTQHIFPLEICSFSSPPINIQESQTHPTSKTLHASTSFYISTSSPPLPPNLSEGPPPPTPKIKNHVPPNPVSIIHVSTILTLPPNIH